MDRVRPWLLEDEIGPQLVAPDDGWRARPDMDPDGTRGFRAAIVARVRFTEDLVANRLATASPTTSSWRPVWTRSSLAERYFAERTDGPRPSTGEDFVVATT